MICWPDNPIASIIRDTAFPVKTISISMPDSPVSHGCMIWLKYDAGMNIRDPRMDVSGVKASGWSRAADTYIYHPDHVTSEQLQEWISETGFLIGAGYMYRWHYSKGRSQNHLWGLTRYSICGNDTAHGDANPDLAEMAEKYGCFSWEINCAWRKAEGHTAYLFPKWKEHDPTLTTDGTRAGNFPGWNGEHLFVRALKPDTGYESRYYFCRPEKYNKHRDVLLKNVNELN